jgi:Tfp pilus assembly protein PilX
MRTHRTGAACRQRGAAALIITLILFFAMVLASMFASRNLLIEQRTSADQYRSTQAFETAEAGIEWALAQINDNVRIGPDCLTTGDPARTSFRTRYLAFTNVGSAGAGAASTANGVFTPNTWINGGRASALQPMCVRYGEAWSCSCPDHGPPTPTLTPTPTTGKVPTATFTLQFIASPTPGVVRLVATGCTDINTCLVQPSSSANSGATAKIEVVLGLIPGLRMAPVAAVTTGGSFDSGSASVALRNTDPNTGIAIDAGGEIAASFARVAPPAGAPTVSALISHDPALAAKTPDRFFATHFGMDKATWRRQPAVKTIGCHNDCSDALIAAIADTPDIALIWIDGDLSLSRATILGSASHPVIIVVDGAALFESAIQLSGVIYSRSMVWSHSDGDGFVHGAALIEANYAGTGTPELAYDPVVLATLMGNSGTFARLTGSWRDF